MTTKTNHTGENAIRSSYGCRGTFPTWCYPVVHQTTTISVISPTIIMSNSLTIAEKEHWKDRISARIESRVDALYAEEPNFIGRVEKNARDRALESAGILALQRRVDSIEKEEADLDDRSGEILDQIDKKVNSDLKEIEDQQRSLREKHEQLYDAVSEKKRRLEEKMQPALDEIEKGKDGLQAQKVQMYREILSKLDGVPLRKVDDDPYNPERRIDDAISKQVNVERDNALAKSARGRKILALREEKENLLDTVWLATSGKQIKDLWEKVDKLLGNTQTNLQKEAVAIVPVQED